MSSNEIRPGYYKAGGIEVWDIIEAFKLNFNLGSVVKYVCRHAGKAGLEDLKKAATYINREIQLREAALERVVRQADPFTDPDPTGPPATPVQGRAPFPAVKQRLDGAIVLEALTGRPVEESVQETCFTPGCRKRAGHAFVAGDEMHDMPPPADLHGASPIKDRDAARAKAQAARMAEEMKQARGT